VGRTEPRERPQELYCNSSDPPGGLAVGQAAAAGGRGGGGEGGVSCVSLQCTQLVPFHHTHILNVCVCVCVSVMTSRCMFKCPIIELLTCLFFSFFLPSLFSLRLFSRFIKRPTFPLRLDVLI